MTFSIPPPGTSAVPAGYETMPPASDPTHYLFELAVQCEAMAASTGQCERRNRLIAQAAEYREEAERLRLNSAFTWK